MNKEEIIKTAREIGTYDISILPYPDCCTIFAPKHPITRPHFWTMIKEFKRMEIEGLILKAVQKTEKISF
jgi:thiamine biosynthesis protein ThiI